MPIHISRISFYLGLLFMEPLHKRGGEITFLQSAPKFHIQPCFVLVGSQLKPVCPSGKNKMETNTSKEHWWNETDRAEPKYSEKNMTQCHFVRHKSQTYWSGIEPGR